MTWQYINAFKLVLKIFNDLNLDKRGKIQFSRILGKALNILEKIFLTKECYFGFTCHL